MVRRPEDKDSLHPAVVFSRKRRHTASQVRRRARREAWGRGSEPRDPRFAARVRASHIPAGLEVAVGVGGSRALPHTAESTRVRRDARSPAHARAEGGGGAGTEYE